MGKQIPNTDGIGEYPLDFPTVVCWDITNECNLRCTHCYCAAGTNFIKPLSITEFCLAVRYLASNGAIRLNIAGGEPLVTESWYQIVTTAVSEGMRVTLATNGLLVDDKTATRIAASGLHRVQVSIDGSNQSSYEKIRGKGARLSKALRAIELIRDRKVAVGVGVLVNKYNCNSMTEIFEKCRERGVTSFALFRLMRVGRGKNNQDNLELSEAQYIELLKTLRDSRKRFLDWGIGITSHDPFISLCVNDESIVARQERFSHFGCQAGRTLIYIRPDGELRPCPFLEINIGNIKNQDIERLWVGQVGHQLRSDSEIVPDGCRDCQLKRVCRGGCRGMAYTYATNFYSPDPLCVLNPKLAASVSTVLNLNALGEKLHVG